MFRPVVAIIRFYHSTRLRLFYTIRMAACLMRRTQHQNPCWNISSRCSNKGFDYIRLQGVQYALRMERNYIAYYSFLLT